MSLDRVKGGRLEFQKGPTRRAQREAALAKAAKLVETICCLAGTGELTGSHDPRLRQAIQDQDTPYLFEHLVQSFSLQGVSDFAAWTYMENHGQPTWQDLTSTTERVSACAKLRGYWTFENCGYRKAVRTCAEPAMLRKCSVPRHDLRNGRLNQMTFSLFFFIRDVADNNLVNWIDRSIGGVGSGARDRVGRMQHALIDPLRNVYGVSDKVLNMAFADILLAAPVTKPLWREIGVSMIAIDRLVHAFLTRTGISKIGSDHAYGSACYSENGCADIIRKIARRIDASQFGENYPRNFPRFTQHAIWRYSAQSELNVCNGNNIDDRHRCVNKDCPLYNDCSRIALHA